jgi:chemotaxis signal transduction protein
MTEWDETQEERAADVVYRLREKGYTIDTFALVEAITASDLYLQENVEPDFEGIMQAREEARWTPGPRT